MNENGQNAPLVRAGRRITRELNGTERDAGPLDHFDREELAQELAHAEGFHIGVTREAIFVYRSRRAGAVVLCLRRPGRKRFRLYELREIALGTEDSSGAINAGERAARATSGEPRRAGGLQD